MPGSVVKERLRDARHLELMSDVGVEFVAGEALQVVLNGNALAQGLVDLKRQGSAEQGLADQQESEIVDRIHVEVQQKRDVLQGVMT